MASEPDWSLYRTFLAVMREGSLSAAARQLGATQPTVGRQVAALERALNCKLFSRSQAGLLPTPASRELLPHAEMMAAASAAIQRASSGTGQEPTGTVRLSAGEQIGLEVLPPILADFALRHPRIAIELSLSNRNEDLLKRAADLAVRMARPTQKLLVCRRIGSVKVGLFAHRRYIEMRGAPRTPADLPHHCLIGFDRDMSVLRS